MAAAVTHRRVHLVACVAKKLECAASAADLYRSDWFVKARAYVEAQGGPWFILSAKHGLLAPDMRIEPYDTSLHEMSAAERRAWGERVAAQLDQVIDPSAPVVLLAGRLYRDPLKAWAGDRAAVPMKGLGIGHQKQWFIKQTDRSTAEKGVQNV